MRVRELIDMLLLSAHLEDEVMFKFDPRGSEYDVDYVKVRSEFPGVRNGTNHTATVILK
jgi:hypothetical protein